MNKLFRCILLFIGTLTNFQVRAQTPPQVEEQLEDLAAHKDAVPENDQWVQDLEEFREHPVNLNEADETELSRLGLLTPVQISSLLRYRSVLGKLISLYELQAVPGWELNTIRELLPYVSVVEKAYRSGRLPAVPSSGEQQVLIRAGETIERARGFLPVDSGANHYLGSPLHLLLRYSGNFQHRLQVGFLGEKDSGEQFFRGARSSGFDFYSGFVAIRNPGLVRALVLGDFIINLGQGLLQWQGLAFSKGPAILNIARQSAAVLPYHSAGENNFLRGAAIQLQQGRWQGLAFASHRRIDGNTISDTDDREDTISSLQNSGYHRTPAELADRKDTRQDALGFSLAWQGDRVSVGLQGIGYWLSKDLQKADRLYNYFAPRGSRWLNLGVDYRMTWRNGYFFGEAALDKEGHPAVLQGMLFALGSRADAAILYRYIHKAYHSLYGDAFTESAVPGNETGFYAGLVLRPASAWQINAYMDIFRFPWLKYQVNAMSHGAEYLVQANYAPAKNITFRLRVKAEEKWKNGSAGSAPLAAVIPVKQVQWRFDWDFQMSRAWRLRSIAGYTRVGNPAGESSRGWLNAIELTYNGSKRGIRINTELLFFDTDDYNSRFYLYEHNLKYNLSLPVFYGKGVGYSININKKFNLKCIYYLSFIHQFEISAHWRQIYYPEKAGIGTGLDFISNNKKSEYQAQLCLKF